MRLHPAAVLILAALLLGAAFRLPGEWGGALFGWMGAAAFACALHGAFSHRWKSLMLFGIVLYFTGCPWFVRVVQFYTGTPLLVAVLLTAVGVLLAALQFIWLGFLYQGLNFGVLRTFSLALPLAWLGSEGTWPKVFPWELGATQLGFPAFVQIADIVGTAGPGFLMLWVCSSLWRAVFCFRRSSLTVAAVSLLFFALSLTYGISRLSPDRVQFGQVKVKSEQALKLLLIQPNFDPQKEFGKESVISNLNRQRALTSQAIESRGLPDLVIWPETSVGLNYYSHEVTVERGASRDPFPGLVVPLLFGGQRQLSERSFDGKVLFHNSAMLLDPLGRFIGTYDKRRLFPLSESLPFSSWLPSLNRLSRTPYRIESGKGALPPMTLFLKNHAASPLRLAVAICYEDMEPTVYNSYFAQSNPDLLIAVTNDTWFLDTIALRQHHALAALRAIEFRRYLVRTSVDGISAVVDPLGRTVEELPAGEAGWLFSNQARPMSGHTVYASYGNQVVSFFSATLCIFATLACLFLRKWHQ